VRGLALLLNHVTHPRLRARLLSELIARAIKVPVHLHVCVCVGAYLTIFRFFVDSTNSGT
jgi:hypothetical protein